MKSSPIFAPFLCQMVLTIVVWVYMYARRISFITRSNLKPQQCIPQELARISPPAVSNPSDNLKNLFELPTIFYGIVLYLYVTNQVDTTYIVAAWIFVIFRIFHSAIHCTINIIMLRFWLYCISAVSLWFMVIRSVVRYVF